MSIHNDILKAIGKVQFQIKTDKYFIKTEIENGRIYLPMGKEYENRRTNLIYADAVLYKNESPISVVEIVHTSPNDPNGITGHIINVDKCCEVNSSINGLLYIVISSIKTFYCKICDTGHKLTLSNEDHFDKVFNIHSRDNFEILHDGASFNYKKVIIDFNITKYLTHINNISVSFINEDISIYENNDILDLLVRYVRQHVIGKSSDKIFYGIEELVPKEIRGKHLTTASTL